MKTHNSKILTRLGGSASGARGFTLIEMLLVLMILGTLAAIVVPKFAGRSEDAKITAAQTQISTFSTALDAFEVDMSYYPSTADSLQVLQTAPKDSKSWRGPYLKQAIPLDPWKNPYIYEYPGKSNEGSYDLLSMGADGRRGSEDDITNWSDTEK